MGGITLQKAGVEDPSAKVVCIYGQASLLKVPQWDESSKLALPLLHDQNNRIPD